MEKSHLLLLLHMHQPYYYDPSAGVYRLPWTRLHGAREYYDVISLALKTEEARLTINVVPSLLIQLRDYETDPSRDEFWRLSVLDPDSMSESEKCFALKNFFLANWKNMIFPIPRYKELLEKRGREVAKLDWKAVCRRFNKQDVIDLQTLFNLAWLGFTAMEEFPQARELLRKGREFDAADRDAALDVQAQVLKRVLPRFSEAAATGRVELSVTPAYHPILPLLYDNNISRRSDPTTPIPAEPFRYPEDARGQIERGRALFEEFFGERPKGMWPSEGAVSPEIAQLVARDGFSWLASDEEIITTSQPSISRDDAVYSPWKVRQGTDEINMIFRDKRLSDLIGFTYSKNAAKAGVAHFIGSLEEIAKRTGGGRQIAVILDGENPWENYENGGREFMETLYNEVAKSPFVEMATISESLAARPPRRITETIHSASWINNNFRVWIGGEEENLAWTYLSKTRRALADFPQKDSPQWREALEAVYAAEGSDWFWWYGDTFVSETPELFDELFRAHLAAVYKRLGQSVPDFVSVPALREKINAATFEPSSYISPRVTGDITNFYEWRGAGKMDLRRAAGGGQVGAMAKTSHYIKELYVGFDKTNLYLRLDFAKDEIDLPRKIIEGEGEIEFYFASKERGLSYRLLVVSDGGRGAAAHFARSEYGCDRIDSLKPNAGTAAIKASLVAALPVSEFGLPPGERLNMAVRILKEEPDGSAFEMARYPLHGYYAIRIPEEDFEKRNWSAI